MPYATDKRVAYRPKEPQKLRSSFEVPPGVLAERDVVPTRLRSSRSASQQVRIVTSGCVRSCVQSTVPRSAWLNTIRFGILRTRF